MECANARNSFCGESRNLSRYPESSWAVHSGANPEERVSNFTNWPPGVTRRIERASETKPEFLLNQHKVLVCGTCVPTRYCCQRDLSLEYLGFLLYLEFRGPFFLVISFCYTYMLLMETF